MGMQANKRSLKNIALTRRFHWAYIGDWLLLTVALVVVAECLLLAIVNTLSSSSLFFDPQKVSLLSVLVCVVVILGLACLGALWAHRIAGVHIRSESVLRQAAAGDLSVQLRFRAGDDLEEVEDAFQAMMATLRGEPPEEALSETPSLQEESVAERERRSWQNMELTSRYHYKYMAIWILTSIFFLAVAYTTVVLYLYVLNYSGGDFQLEPLVWFVTLSSGIIGGYLVWRGIKTSHRLAGVHVKLARTFQRVARGEKDVTLRFRAGDKLDAIEAAFEDLMNSCRQSDS